MTLYVFTADTIAEPDFGAEPEGAFARLIELMQADQYLAQDVPILRRMIIGDLLPDWHRAQIDIGLTDRSYRALGLGPLFRPEGEPLARRLTIGQSGRPSVVVGPKPTP